MRKALILLTAAAALAACGSADADSGSSGDGKQVTYTLESDAKTVSATYATADANGIGTQQDNGVPVPWTKTVQVEDSWLSGQAFVLSGSMDPVLDGSGADGTTITCRIEVDGEVVAEQTSTGQYATVSCTSS